MKNRNHSLDYKVSSLESAQWALVSNTPKSPTVHGLNSKNSGVESQLINVVEKSSRKKFKELIKGVRGRNNPINYEQKFDFLQRWQTLNRENDFQKVKYELPQNSISIIFHALELISKVLVIWFVSVYRIYDMKIFHWPFILGISFVLINIALKIVITTNHYFSIRKENQLHFNSSKHLKSLIKIFVDEIYTLIYYSVLLLVEQPHDFRGFIVFDIITGFFEYQKGQKIYKKLKLYIIRSSYRNYMNLFDLMSNLFIIFHFCAILLYSLTLFSESNWINAFETDQSDWYCPYLYSFYFTSTTMLTVGYGDIFPTNKLQVFAIILLQVLGTATNGYIFSEVGHTLAKIRQKKQTQQKDISDTEKLAKVYRLDTQLAKKVRGYIVHNDMENQELNVDEENKLLLKLNDELRTEVNNCNHIQIIKENIFFLFYFSKKAQIEFAKRLQRRLFSPNETIHQLQGKEKLWIVTKGKLEIFTDRKQGMRYYCKKKLKEINMMDKKEISDNIFGYSSIVWGRPTNLRANTKDFTVIYILQKSELLQVIHDDSNDFQSFSEMKEKILLQKCPQRWEVPRITSIREHYSPSIFFLIKKDKQMLSKINTKKRKRMIRSDRRCKSILSVFVDDLHNPSQSNSEQEQLLTLDNLIEETLVKTLNSQQRNKKYTKIMERQSQVQQSKNIVLRSYKRKYLSKKKLEERRRQEIIEKWKNFQNSETMIFEVGKNFNSFFKKRNLSEVIYKIKNKESVQNNSNLMIGEIIRPFISKRQVKGNSSCSI